MKYTEALEVIYQDRSKVFYGRGRWDFLYKVSGNSDRIVLEYVDVDQRLSSIPNWVMETDWKEEKNDV